MYLQDSNFNFLIQAHYTINNTDVILTQDNDIFSIRFQQVSRSGRAAFNNRTRVVTSLTKAVWSENFTNWSNTLNEYLEITGPYIWLDSYDFELQGSRLSDQYKRLEFWLSKWENSTDSDIIWQDESIIEEAVQSLEINIYMIDHYFDLNDYQTPIKPYISDKFRYFGINSLSQEALFYLQENEAILSDQYMSLSSQEQVIK